MILVTGAKGQVGSDVCSILSAKNEDFLGIDISDLDLCDTLGVASFFESHKINSVIHCAAYTAVDKAETDIDLCRKVNVSASENIAINCQKHGAKLIYISTDYVFNGKGELAFNTSDTKAAINVYGQSKLDGEIAVKANCDKYFIVRTSWVFGEKNTNFIHTMLKLSEKLSEVKVVCDQIGSPTYSWDLATLLCQMIKSEKYGEYHATNEGFTSWNNLAEYAFKKAEKSMVVTPVATSEYKTCATRPLNSRLSKQNLTDNGFDLLPTWENAVDRYLNNIL